MLRAIVSNQVVYLRAGIGTLASLGSSLTESAVFANEISSDLDEIHMRSRWDISSSSTRYLMRSDEILWDWMRLLHGRRCCRLQRETNLFQPIAFASSTLREQRNPEEIAG